MDLNSIAGAVVAAVNPLAPVEVLISVGDATNADGTREPAYATPGSITASISGTALTVTAIASGVLLPGQSLADLTTALRSGTAITEQLTGDPGGLGTYSVNISQDVASYKDLQMLEGINLGGARWKVYLHGAVNAVVRPERKGGDLIVVPVGPHAGTWLINQVLEQFRDWCSAAITLQNGG
jgi:hypothetical protein